MGFNFKRSFGFICTNEEIVAVQARPTAQEQVVIDRYREAYKKAFGHVAHGLHYIPFPGEPEIVGVWIPIEEDADATAVAKPA